MNYQDFAEYDEKPIEYNNFIKKKYDDGKGISKLNENNITIEDIYKTPFLFTHFHKKNYKNMAETALKGIQCNNDLSKLFFSDRNIKRLQKKIKKEIYKRTKGEFKLEVDQDVQKLMIAMRAVYLQYARFLPSQIVRQCKRLNERVVEEIIPNMISEIRQYYGYIKEINEPIKPIMRPQNINKGGRKQLPSITKIWN